MTDEEVKRKILSYLGFAKKSGRIALGAEQVIKSVREGSARAVIASSDSSERTKKQIYDKCASYGAPIAPVDVTGDEIASALGCRMTVSAAAVTDTGLARAILEVPRGEHQLKERIFPQESGNR